MRPSRSQPLLDLRPSLAALVQSNSGWRKPAPHNRCTFRRFSSTEDLATVSGSSGDTAQFGSLNDDDDWFFTECGQKDWVEAMELNTLTPDTPELLREMGVSYDPERLTRIMNARGADLYIRAAQITTAFGSFIAKLARDYATGQIEPSMKKRATQLRNLLAELGPSFVKIGQALSSRPDLLPRVYLETLSELQDSLPSFPNKIAMTVIEEELGKPINAMFAEITARPVAAASLGQVYKGKLPSGEEVAVKVQRPGIGENIALDMVLLRRLMGVFDRNVDFITQPLVPLVDEFGGRLFAELDYIAEGHNCESFQKLYGEMPRIRTPKIYWDYTSRRVLTMEWIDGVKLTDAETMQANDLDVVDFVDVGIECTLRQLLEAGFFHADPHPGNLLATKSGDLVYLDFGMMSTAPEYARYALIAHVVHLVNRDYDAMCRDYYELEFMDRSVDTSPIAPALAAFFDNVLDKSVSQLNFKAIVDGLGEVLFEFPFRVPSYYALILRSLTVLEGMALQADPEYKLLAKAYPYMARRLLTDPVPQLRSSFEDLVLQDGRFRWSRLENLMRESSKSRDFESSQLWVLAEWFVSPSAESVRDPLVQELSKMVDAWAAGNARQGVSESIGGELAARKLLPEQPGELLYRQRANLVVELLRQQLGGRLPNLEASGPLGLSTPADLQKGISNLTQQAEATAPRLYNLLTQPGAVNMVAVFIRQLSLRFAARSVKFLAASQELGEAEGKKQ